MWTLENNVFKETDFPFHNMMTTSACGNMKDDSVRRAFCASNGIEFDRLITLEQTHSSNIAVVGWEDRGKKLSNTDGLITRASGLPLAIFTADCLPVFIAHKGSDCVGIIHAGWQGVAKEIVPLAVKLMKKEFKIKASELFVSIGAHIQKECFEVGEDLREIFEVDKKIKNLELSEIVKAQLKEVGVSKVSVNEHCTCHEKELFYSFRRDKGSDRMMSVVMI